MCEDLVVRRRGPAGIGAVVAVVVAALGVGWRDLGLVAAFAASRSPAVDPPYFLMVTAQDAGTTSRVELRSPLTGRLAAVVGRFGSAFTNNGLTQSRDGRDVYVTFSGARTLTIERIDVRTASRTVVADGERPALSRTARSWRSAPAHSAQSGWRSVISGPG